MYTMDRAKWKLYAKFRKNYPEYANEFKVNYLKTACRPCENQWKVFCCSDSESVIEKRFFPYHFTPEEQMEFTEELWERIYSPYDCTGQWFTKDVKFFKIHNGTWIYHFKSIDI